jgi:hypothetical protein
MKKMFSITMLLLLIYIIIQAIYGYFVGQHVLNYKFKIDDKIYNIKEKFTNKYRTTNYEKDDLPSYYYEISLEKDTNPLFNFKIVGSYTGVSHFLQNIKVYNDNNMTCIYPIFKDNQNLLDVMCNKDSKQLLYRNIKGENKELDQFVVSLIKDGYNHYSWHNPDLSTTKLDNINIYKYNYFDSLYIALWNYKGIYLINGDNSRNLHLLGRDQYNNNLSALINYYYIIPDYSAGGSSFNRFLRTDLRTGNVSYISISPISFDSFIQGVVENKLYIIDRNNKIQYQFDVENKKLSIIGDTTNQAKYYYNGAWKDKSIFDIIDNTLKFGRDSNIPSSFNQYNAYLIDEVMGDSDGCYYLYIKDNGKTKVYRADKQNPNLLTLLFTTNSISNVKYIDDMVYYIDNDTLYIYSDKTGLRALVKYNELAFNHSNMYDIYISNE